MSYASDKARWLREFTRDWERRMFKMTPDIEKTALWLAAKGLRPRDAAKKMTAEASRRNPGKVYHERRARGFHLAAVSAEREGYQQDAHDAYVQADVERENWIKSGGKPFGKRRNPLMMIMENPGRRRNPFWRDSYRHVEYHSPEWAQLVEQGWTTMTVDNGVATMIRQEGAGGRLARNPQQVFDVYLRRRKIDTVFYGANTKVDVEEVRRSLVNHDGYDPGIKVVRRREDLRRNPGFSGTAPSFQSTLARLAKLSGVAAEQIYEYWREYARDCQSYDQSPALGEFVAWYKGKLGGDLAALQDTVQGEL